MSEQNTPSSNTSDADLGAYVAVEHVRELSFVTHKRTYETKSPFSIELGGGASVAKLPEEGHWRLCVEGQLSSIDATGELTVDAKCVVEAVIVLRNFVSPEQVRDIMVFHFTGHLLGTIRSRLSSVSLLSGFPATLFPVLSRGEIERFASGIQVTEV